ncbi:hypothetical protein LJC26_07485 [Desulfovibrio sp. OttesenSCG-928-O18]|nr:hypothetical protein [Desulfovibrio sp. OttesenSCG-928-O18]
MKKIRVVFLVHNIANWDCLSGVYAAMVADDAFSPVVASLPRRFPGSNKFECEEETDQALTKLGVDHIRLTNADSYADLEVIKNMQPDFLFRQSWWDYDIPEAYAARNLGFSKLCYIPYCILFMTGLSLSPDVRGFLEACDIVFFPDNVTHQLYLLLTENKAKGKGYITGNPSIAAAREAEPHWPINSPTEKPRYRIIWAPHHSITGHDLHYGTFLETSPMILNWATSAKDIEFVLRPHPALLSTLDSLAPVDTHQVIPRFFDAWNALENTSFSTGETYWSLFAASDLMLSDGISFLLEYQVFQKPVIFIERPDRAPFLPHMRRLEDGIHTVKSVPEAMEKIISFKNGYPDPLKEEQAKICTEFFHAHGSVERIIAALKENYTP